MDAETRREIENVLARIRWLADQHEREWRIAAFARNQWSAELDATQAQVDLHEAAIRDMVREMNERATNLDIERKTVAIGESVGSALEGFARTLLSRFETVLNEHRASIAGEMEKVRGGLAAMAIEQSKLHQAHEELMEGIHGLSAQLSDAAALDVRLTRVERAVGERDGAG